MDPLLTGDTVFTGDLSLPEGIVIAENTRIPILSIRGGALDEEEEEVVEGEEGESEEATEG